MNYTIKEISKIVDLTPYTLRYYEKEGILPTINRDGNGNRIYNDKDIEWLGLICCMRSTGMSIVDIKHYVDLCKQGEKTIRDRRQIILHQKEILEARLNEVRGYLKRINKKLQFYDELGLKQGLDVLNPNSHK